MLSCLRDNRCRDYFIFIPLFLVFFILMILSTGDYLPGEAGEFISAGGFIFPFVILALLAHMSRDHPWIRYLANLWLLCILFALFAISLIITLAPVAALSPDPDALEPALDALPIGTVAATILTGLCAGIICLTGFSRRFRGLLARVLPFDPDSYVHMIGLICVIAMIVMPLIPLIVTHNAPFLNAELQDLMGLGAEVPGSSVKTDTYSLIWTIIGSFFLVGLWIARDARSTLKRLGLVRPTANQVLYGIASGVFLVGIFIILDDGVTALFTVAGIPTTDENLVNNLFVASFTPLAAFVASVSAGLGEELSVRGVIQPRFGIIAAALVFAALHAYQYAWDGVLTVFIAGICFGIIRQYTNTTTSAISHGVYDFVLFCLIMAGITGI